MNLLEKSKMRKNIKEIVNNNKQVIEFNNILIDKYDLEEKEINNINMINKHMENLTTIFQEMNRGIKKK